MGFELAHHLLNDCYTAQLLLRERAASLEHKQGLCQAELTKPAQQTERSKRRAAAGSAWSLHRLSSRGNASGKG